ncbi:carboxypeptidase regulatory-like domain-containing protein [Microbacterium sp. LS_15]|uniref:MSCRAMM family protein n=1 Tax=Microbacterium sp. LS_15 TaxID=3055790 RepID=UPI0035C261E0
MARRRAFIRAVLGGAAALALALGGVTTAAEAADDPVGSISGTVARADDGSPVAGVTVSADGPTWASTTTDSTGAYTLPGLAAGSYVVSFFPEGTDLKREFWEGAFVYDQATPVVVGVGEVVPGIDASLDQGGAVEGTVTRSADGSSFANVFVQALDDQDEIVGQTTTDASGRYTLGGLPAGSYRVRFADAAQEFVPEYWRDAYAWGAAKLVTVVEKQTVSSVDAALEVAGFISGTVTRAIDGQPLLALVTIYEAELDLIDIPGAWTEFDGSYRIAVPPGSYKLLFGSTGLKQEYWDDAEIWETATAVTVAAGQEVTGIDPMLEPSATITGTVTVDSAAPSQIWVEAWQNGQNVRTIGANAVTGAYTMHVSKGPYILKARIEFADGSITAKSQYFDGVDTAQEATPITVVPGQSVTGVDFALTVDTVAPEPEPRPALSLTASTVRAGGAIQVVGEGFSAGEVVAFELHSDPIALGSLTADQSGRLSGTLRIPASAPAGVHTLVALGAGGAIQASAAVQVTAAVAAPSTGAARGSATNPDRLAATGNELPATALLAGLFLAVVGTVLVRRRRAHS